MNRIIFSVFAMALAWAPPASAQEINASVELRFNAVVEVDPGRIDEFEAAWRTICDHAEQDGFHHYTVMAEDRNQRLITSVIVDYANIGDIHDFVARYHASEKAEVKEAAKTLLEATRSVSSYVSNYDHSLSYAPPGSYAGPFHERKTLHFDVRDTRKVALLLAKKRDLWAAAEIPDAFHVQWNVVGSGLSSVTIRTSASDEATHRSIFQSVKTALASQQATALAADLEAVTKRQSIVNWIGRAELALSPLHMRED